MPLISKTERAQRRKAKRINAAILQFAKDISDYEGVTLPICKPKRKVRRLLITEQAAKRLGRKKHTLENWRSIGIGPAFHKVGGNILYDRTEITRYLNERKFESTSAYFAPPAQQEAQ